jgi:hypothetical protein
MKFLFLLRDDAGAVAALTPEQRRAMVDEHMAFNRELRERGALLAGEGLDGTVFVVRPGEAQLVTDGPFAETKEELGGFYLIECASKDEAIELAKRMPYSPGLAIEVLRVAEL